MHFLSDVYVPCEVCQGKRYNAQTLAVRYKGYSIADVLGLSISDCAELFANHRRLKRILQTLLDVGLGYMKIGQTATTMSGGEAQRVKLSRELGKVQTGRTLYILDEPTTGLHFEDIRRLLEVLQRLVDAGNTVLVIEHNLDVIKCADWLIDLGPEGGEGGGEVVATGTPEAVATVARSHTGMYLQPLLKGRRAPARIVKKAKRRTAAKSASVAKETTTAETKTASAKKNAATKATTRTTAAKKKTAKKKAATKKTTTAKKKTATTKKKTATAKKKTATAKKKTATKKRR
jgi:ABC-type multidrug transport system ATPase subunit